MAFSNIFLLSILICAAQTTVSSFTPDPQTVRSPAPSIPDLYDSSSAAAAPSSALLGPILANLGFQELAMAVPSLSDASFPSWTGPTTVFAPSDKSVRSCPFCSMARILREHTVPGVFSLVHLRKLAFGTKLETLSADRCVTVTISAADNATTVFIDGVEITHPDLFNDGRIVIHGLKGFISHLSPLSCRSSPPPLASASFSFPNPSSIVRLMLRDAMVRLRNDGYSVLALALRVKFAELASLQNMTIFALDDDSIFGGGHAYVSNVRFHIVPNRFLMFGDLLKMSTGTTLETLVQEQLVITNGGAPMRINYVPFKAPDVMFNLKIVVHGIFLPFPHLHAPSITASVSAASMDDGIFQASTAGICTASDSEACNLAPFGEPKLEVEDDVL